MAWKKLKGTVSHDTALSPGDDKIKQSNLMAVQKKYKKKTEKMICTRFFCTPGVEITVD
jgi:hypothetical protein